MKLAARIALSVVLVGTSTGLLALQRDGMQRYRFDQGSDTEEKDEFTFTRLRYSTRAGGFGDFGGFGGFRNGGWSEDYPKADRQFVQGVVRLTRLDARSTQQVVDPDSDDIFNWPWLYAVNVGTWDFTEPQAKRMRDYLQRGGFLVVDNFHGAADWEHFMIGMRKILPNAQVEDLGTNDEVFHVLYDLDQRYQVPGYQYIWTGKTYEKDGLVPQWRGIRDEQGRLMVLICHNMHLGDAWEHADDPRYPERFSSFAYRLGINYIIYGMTH